MDAHRPGSRHLPAPRAPRLLLLVAVALLVGTAPVAQADEKAKPTGSTWDWRLSTAPGRVLASVLDGANDRGGTLLVLEPTKLAAGFWRRLAEAPVPERTPAISFTFEGSSRVSEPVWKRSALASALRDASPHVPGYLPDPLETLERALAWAEQYLPPPRALLYVSTRGSAGPRKKLEPLLAKCRAAACRVFVVAPEVAFSDNAQTVLHGEEPVGEAPIEEVPFDLDFNLPALWLAPIRWSPTSADLVPDDVKWDPWYGHKWCARGATA